MKDNKISHTLISKSLVTYEKIYQGKAQYITHNKFEATPWKLSMSKISTISYFIFDYFIPEKILRCDTPFLMFVIMNLHRDTCIQIEIQFHSLDNTN